MNIFQSPEWEQFKLATGYQKSYRIDEILILQKNLPMGRSMLYSPKVEPNSESEIVNDSFLERIKEIAKNNKSIFYRLEIDKPIIHDSLFVIHQNFVKSFEEMQPEHTLILNVSKSEQDILAGMKQKGRYNIKVADKHKIKIRKSRQIDDFYRLYAETAKRQKITHRDKQYFRALLDNLEPKGYCELFEAYVDKSQIVSTKSSDLGSGLGRDGQTNQKSEILNSKQFNNPSRLGHRSEADTTIQQSDSSPTAQNDKNEIILAAAIVAFYKGRATYLFGASSSEMRNLMTPYKLHWQIILEAKRRGIIEYDLFGIAPDDNLKHAWAGVTRFKKQFGGNEVKLLGSWDMIIRPTEYRIFKIAERLRRRK